MLSKSIDKFKDKEIRNIVGVKLHPDTYGRGSAEWQSELLFLKGYWNMHSKDFVQKVTIEVEIQNLGELFELVEDQTEEDRKLLRGNRTETNLTNYSLISHKGLKAKNAIKSLKEEVNNRSVKPIPSYIYSLPEEDRELFTVKWELQELRGSYNSLVRKINSLDYVD